jgi:hypothetical protein
MSALPTKIITGLLPDDPLQQSAATPFNATDRQYIDTQVLGCQQHLATLLLNGVHGTYLYVAQTSASLVAGDVVCLAGSSLGYPTVTLALATPLGIARAALGVVLLAASPGTRALIAIDGVIGPDITGLAAVAGFARVNSSGRCQRVTSLSSGDYPIGTVDAQGYLTLTRALAIGTGSSSGTLVNLLQGVVAFDDDDFASLAAGVKTFTKNLGAAPTGTRYLNGVNSRIVGAFDDGAGGTYQLEVGWSAFHNALIDRSAATSGLYLAGNGGDAVVNFELSGLQLEVRLTSNHDLNTCTAGYLEVNLSYF